MFFCVISPKNSPELVIEITKFPTRGRDFPTNGLLGVLRPPAPHWLRPCVFSKAVVAITMIGHVHLDTAVAPQFRRFGEEYLFTTEEELA